MTAFKQLKVPPVSRTAIDAWPLTDAGLPLRVANACKRHNLKTIAELRSTPAVDLMQIRSFGWRSLDDVESFFKFCSNLERGRIRFDACPILMSHLLDRKALSMLEARYSLKDNDVPGLARGRTLDSIGRELGLTRERVRQQLLKIHRRLQSCLAHACLAPLVKWYADFMLARDGIIGPDELADVPFKRWLDGYNPCHLLQLLVKLQPPIMLRGGMFSLVSPETVNEIEKTAVLYLHRYPKPQRLSDVIAEFEEKGWFRKDPRHTPQMVIKVLELSNAIGATRDDFYFLFPEGAVYLLATLTSEFPHPVRRRALVKRFNEEVKPLSRRTDAYITKLLTRSPVFVRGRDGTYRLRK